MNVAKRFLAASRAAALDEDLPPVETGRFLVDAICVADAVRTSSEKQEGGS